MNPAFLSSIPDTYQKFVDAWQDSTRRQLSLQAYQSQQISFIPDLLPEMAVQLSAQETLHILRVRFGGSVDLALAPVFTDTVRIAQKVSEGITFPAELPAPIRSPVADQVDGSWLKRANMVGVNVRTIGSFWNLVKYTLTLPAAQDAIHILPIWEAGVVGSIYGMCSWQLNPEFFSAELANTCPWLDTNDRQLRAVVNLLHMMGRTVGMDVIPHTDRFAEMALAFPEYYEWLQRRDTVILDHSANLHEAVQRSIFEFLNQNGPALPGEIVPACTEDFFQASELPFRNVDEDQRLRLLFGLPADFPGRLKRRMRLIHHLYQAGYETVPATMAPPYRGLQIDTRPESQVVDEDGRVWRDYLIEQPQPMSRVFNPLARYKLYESLENGGKEHRSDWGIDFGRPRPQVWRYVCEKYALMQRRYGFDFMRGDMSHVQMRPDGVPETPDAYYDLLGAVKTAIRDEYGVRYFGYFAESFLAPPDVMGYGDEIDHLEASQADTTLGDLQSTGLGSPEFLQRLRYYSDLVETRACAPNFTVITADKDDPRFDLYYLGGNEVRLFIALCLGDMPSYMALGYETRDLHSEPAPNEHYTKLYVFHEKRGPKATHGPYVWGKNGLLFGGITRLRLYLEKTWDAIQGRPTRWLIPPDATGGSPLLAWTQRDGRPDYIFLVNTSLERTVDGFRLRFPDLASPSVDRSPRLVCDFSTAESVPAADRHLSFNGTYFWVSRLAPAEGRVYRIHLEQANS